MKKTISINIAGVVFHIEEDGYSKLKEYLASIQRYFSTYPDSSEIIADIESRIAERFLNKQRLETKQVITVEDVDELILAMGTVADFAASEQNAVYLDDLEEGWDSVSTSSSSSQETNSSLREESPLSASKPSTIYRDLRRKLLGGVASGIAHRFSIDPLWIRLLCIFFVMATPTLLKESLGYLSGVIIIIYIAMWIAFPGSDSLEEDKSIKKFYRNPDKKVLGGVASGLASYFHVDTGVIRFLFLIGLPFFGISVLLYLVLWIIAPAANTITEKMQMHGEPITLSNIENSIKKKISIEDNHDRRNTLVSFLLIPFTVLSAIITFLEKFLKGLSPIIRFVVGAMLTILSVSTILTLLIGSSVWFSLVDILPFDSAIPSLLFSELPTMVFVSGLLFLLLPSVAFLILGLTLLANRPLVNSSIWITLLGLWVMSIMGAGISGSRFSKNFLRKGEYTVENRYSLNKGTLTLGQYTTNGSFPYDHTWVTLKGYEGDSMLLERVATSKGRTLDDAHQNAHNLQYNVTLKDSILYFDDRIQFSEGDKYRAQDLKLVLMIPYEQHFAMQRSFYFDKVRFTGGNGKSVTHYRLDDESLNFETLRWKFTRDQGLVCINLPAQYLQSSTDELAEPLGLTEAEGKFIQTIVPETNFDKINISNHFVVTIQQAPTSKILIKGTKEEVQEIKTEIKNNQLYITSDEKFLKQLVNNSETIEIEIFTPTVKEIYLSGAVRGTIKDFSHVEDLVIHTIGACKVNMNIQAENITTNIIGASTLTLEGKTTSLKADITGASTLYAEDMLVQTAHINAVGASTANLGIIEDLHSTVAGTSKVHRKINH